MKADELLLLDNRICIPETEISLRKNAIHNDNGLHLRYQLQLLLSFVCGFLMAYTTLIFYDRYLVWSVQIEQHTTATEYYQTGYMMALKDMEIEENSLHDHLKNEIRILCLVLTSPKYHQDRAQHVKKTWGHRCTKLLFMSSLNDEELNTIAIVDPANDVYSKLWNKTRESFRYVYENYLDDYDWFLKADDDTYVIMENLRYMLYAYQPDMPIYFGYEMKLGRVHYMSGGASYILGRGALKRFVEQSIDNTTLCPAADNVVGEDFCMGICLQNVGVLLVNSKFAIEEDKRTKFFPIDLLVNTQPDWNYTLTPWLFVMSSVPLETGLECFSNYTITYHYVSPRNMYAMEFLIYNLQAFGVRHPVGKLPNYLSGGSSYVLSREALRLFTEQSVDNETLCPTGERIDAEDVCMGVCLQNVGVLLANSKFAIEEDKKTKFFPLDLWAYTEPHPNKIIPDWMYQMSVEPVEIDIKTYSNYSVSFHYANPARMYALEYLIYHFQVYGLRRPLGKLPSKISREKVFDKFSKNVSLPITIDDSH